MIYFLHLIFTWLIISSSYGHYRRHLSKLGYSGVAFKKFTHQFQLNFLNSGEGSVISQPQVKEILKYNIREAKINDLSTVASMRVHVFYPEYISIKSFQMRILDKLRQRVNTGSICFVATRQGQNWSPLSMYFGNTLGTVEISAQDFFNTTMENFGATRKLYVADLAVREDCRRMGIATELLKAVENFAILNQYMELYLHVETANQLALNLYRKHGYNEIPMTGNAVTFTQARLHKPVHTYVLLSKELEQNTYATSI